MAKNLIDAGYSLTVWNRSQPSIDELVSYGATAGESPADVASLSDIVITIVTDSPDVEAVTLGADGILEGARSGSVHVDMTTMSPMMTQDIAARLAANGVEMLDAPVSGGAQNGTLSIMVGGPTAAFERCLPVFEVLGANVTHAGQENGLGQFVKLCNQILCGLNILAMCEAISLGSKAGLDLEKMLAAVSKGAGGSWMISNLAPKVVDGDWEPGFMVRLQQKDLRLVLEAASALDLPLPGTSLVSQLFRSVEAAGLGDKGTQSLIHALERLGDFEVSEDA